MPNPITEKQKVAIKNIEKSLGVKFQGNTKQDAWFWMQEYMPKAVEEETIKVLRNRPRIPNAPRFPNYLDNLMSEDELDEFENKYDFDGELDKEINATKRYLGIW